MTPEADKNSQSVYAPGPEEQVIEAHTLAILVKNEPGALARVVGLFSGRGYNIDSLTVAETDHVEHLSRITVVCSGTPQVIEQIIAQLERLVPVQNVRDLTTYGPYIARELALVKTSAINEEQIKKLKLNGDLYTHVVDSSPAYSIFEVTGTSEKIDAFIEEVRPFGLINVSRTGVAATSRSQQKLGT